MAPKKTKKGEKKLYNIEKQKTNGNMVTLNPDILVITLNLRFFCCRLYKTHVKQDTQENQQNFCSTQREI